MVFKSILFGMLVGWLTVGAWFTTNGLAVQSAAFIAGAVLGRMSWWLAAKLRSNWQRQVTKRQFEHVANEL